MDVLELRTSKTAGQVDAESAEYIGLVDVQFPFTPAGWKAAQEAGDYDDCTLTTADGAVYIGTVNDTDPAKCTVTVELR